MPKREKALLNAAETYWIKALQPEINGEARTMAYRPTRHTVLN